MLNRVRQFTRKYKMEGLLLAVTAIFLFIQRPDLTSVLLIVLSYIILVLLLNETFLIRAVRIGIGDIKKEYLYSVLTLIFVILLLIWNFSYEAIIFLILFVAFALYDWDSRIIATGALVSLASCPILLITKQDAIAEQMAVYAYYFLVMTVVLQIIEYKRHPEVYKEDKNEEK
ncbi:MAG: hypothetical protein NT077_01390 [Candidatus Taylorbacteria bacterium]|nr:hypothetical protein [Candidatus Taylorbacteria bacterium]